MRKAAVAKKAAFWKALALGMSVGVQNGIFGIFYLAAGELAAAYPTYEYTQPKAMYIAMFLIIFGAFTAATSSSMGPDEAKAKRSATKIFKIIRTPSKVDVMADDLKDKKQCQAKGFSGKIEFKKVWFRYPARLNQWIFKGLDLTIDPREAVAIVGESGQGKSTFISLVMRFYDPEFGEVLIDGVNVKEYDVNQLR
jgi:ATP-binding cassette subfamily B (MDR/TAP) protein 1